MTEKKKYRKYLSSSQIQVIVYLMIYLMSIECCDIVILFVSKIYDIWKPDRYHSDSMLLLDHSKEELESVD